MTCLRKRGGCSAVRRGGALVYIFDEHGEEGLGGPRDGERMRQRHHGHQDGPIVRWILFLGSQRPPAISQSPYCSPRNNTGAAEHTPPYKIPPHALRFFPSFSLTPYIPPPHSQQRCFFFLCKSSSHALCGVSDIFILQFLQDPFPSRSFRLL